MEMRRKDREVEDINEIKAIMNRCFAVRLGFYDNGSVYIVPVNFGWEERGGAFTLYFHGATEGRKASCVKECARTGASAGFEMDCDGELLEADAACGYSAFYASIIGEGIPSAVENPAEKTRALDLIMRKATGKSGWAYPADMLKKVGVYRFEVTSLQCKRHKKRG